MTGQAPQAESEIDLVIRDETLAHERRTIITPPQVAQLTKEGFRIGLVRWPDRCFSDEQYVRAVEQRGTPENLVLMDHDAWKSDPNCANSIILGVKEIPREPPGSADFILNHTYVHFDHSYKGQYGSAERLARFAFGYLFMDEEHPVSLLLDHEYCTDEDGKRTHAFGQSAGYSTAAMTVLSWAQKTNGTPVGLATVSYDSKEQFFDLHTQEIAEAIQKNGGPPTTLVLGSPRGRSANGVMNFLDDLNNRLEQNNHISHTLWGREETAERITDNEGLKGIEDFDLIFNCTYVDRPCRPFANDMTAAARNGKLQVFGDVTCDTTADKNRLRFSGYRTTDFDAPLLEVGPNVFAITVDHSPSLLPREATIDISKQAYPHIKSLLQVAKFSDQGLSPDSPWAKAVKAFEDNMQVPLSAYNIGSSLVSDDEIFISDLNENERGEYIEDVRNELERNIILSLGDLQPLRPREKRAFLYHVAMGMLRVNEYVDLTKLKPEDQDGETGFKGPDMTGEIEALEQILKRKIDVAAIADSEEVQKLHTLSYILSETLQNPEVMKALGFTSTEDMESRLVADNLPPVFSLFLAYVSEAKEKTIAHLYSEEQQLDIEEGYARMKMVLQTESDLPGWFYEEIEDTINNLLPKMAEPDTFDTPLVDDNLPGM